jgi:hypothetical protein
MAAKKPFFPLFDVKKCAQRRDGLHLFRTKAEASFSSLAEARDPCDVYVAVISGRGWYVKLTLLSEQVLLISFHPLERPIRTARGREVKT